MTLEIEIKFYRMTDRLLDQGPCGAVTTSVFISFIREESECVLWVNSAWVVCFISPNMMSLPNYNKGDFGIYLELLACFCSQSQGIWIESDGLAVTFDECYLWWKMNRVRKSKQITHPYQVLLETGLRKHHLETSQYNWVKLQTKRSSIEDQTPWLWTFFGKLLLLLAVFHVAAKHVLIDMRTALFGEMDWKRTLHISLRSRMISSRLPCTLSTVIYLVASLSTLATSAANEGVGILGAGCITSAPGRGLLKLYEKQERLIPITITG